MFLAGVVLSGCVDCRPPAALLPMGATKSEVRKMIGSPRSESGDGAVTTWNYGGGAVCVFKTDRLISSSVGIPPRDAASFKARAASPDIVAVPYYAPAFYPTPGYYAGAWPLNERYPIRNESQVYVTPACFGKGWGWSGFWYPWWGGYGWFGYPRPYYAGDFWHKNNCHGNYYQGNYYEEKVPAGFRH